jgi:eukaryotic-like serine/threonine-protein kinase
MRYYDERPSMHGSSVFLIALLTSVASAAGTVYFIQRYNVIPPRVQSAPDAVVPDLRGATENDARVNTSAAHLGLFVASREQTPDAKANTIVRQSLAPGMHVPHDSTISVVLAEEIPKVPAVVGVSLGEATQRVEQRGFRIQVGGTMPSPDAGPGLVLDQSPKADTAQAKGSAVIVQVSSGSGDVEMPKVLNVGINQAKTDLEKLGLKVNIRWVAMAETPTYIVLNQKPAPGEKLKPGGEVTLTACR